MREGAQEEHHAEDQGVLQEHELQEVQAADPVELLAEHREPPGRAAFAQVPAESGQDVPTAEAVRLGPREEHPGRRDRGLLRRLQPPADHN